MTAVTRPAGRAFAKLRSSPTLQTSATGIAVYAMSAVTGPLVARAVGPAGRGDLASVTVPSEMLGWILVFGLPQAAMFYASRYSKRELITAAWTFALVVGGVLAAIIFPLVPAYLRAHDPVTIPWLRAFLLVRIVFVPVLVTVHLLRLRPSLVAFNVLRSLQLVLEAVVVITLAITGKLTVQTSLMATFASFVVWYVIVIAYGRGWPAHLEWSALRDSVHYGGRLSFGTLAQLAISRLDQLLLVGVVSADRLGVYAIAATACSISQPAAEGIAMVLFPRLQTAEGPDDAWVRLREARRRTLLASLAIAGLVGGLSPVVLPLLFGNAFRDSVVPLLILLPGQVLADQGTVMSQQLMVDNRPGVVSHALLAAATVTVVGLAIVVVPFGIIGAAAVTTASQATFAGYVVVQATRRHRRALAQ